MNYIVQVTLVLIKVCYILTYTMRHDNQTL